MSALITQTIDNPNKTFDTSHLLFWNFEYQNVSPTVETVENNVNNISLRSVQNNYELTAVINFQLVESQTPEDLQPRPHLFLHFSNKQSKAEARRWLLTTQQDDICSRYSRHSLEINRNYNSIVGKRLYNTKTKHLKLVIRELFSTHNLTIAFLCTLHHDFLYYITVF